MYFPDHMRDTEHMATIQVTTTTEIPDQFLADLITAAVEGGVNYWAEVSAYVWDVPDPTLAYAVLHEVGDEAEADPTPLNLTTDAVARGLLLLAETDPRRFGRLVDPDNDWDHDAEDADVIAQLALLGEVVYG